ncbi:MAG: putative lipoprotein [Ignavibacteriae bacterium]|nr:MAG: putative lipoprotein [Ignavibacteriota bacterium]
MRKVLLLFCIATGVYAQNLDQPLPFSKPSDKDQRQVVNVGNLQLTVTNYGTLGTRNAYWPQQFAAEYPKGSRIEHLYQGGVWFGAISRKRGRAGVSTGATDRCGSGTTGLHYEFSSEPGASILKRSIDPFSGLQTEGAVSELDFVCEYTDKYTRDPVTGDSIPYHMPLGITVHQESYAWSLPTADFFVILSYTFTNTGYRDPNTGVTVKDTLDSVYVGLWNNFVVRNTNFVRPGTTGYFNVAAGYDSVRRMAYAFDFDGNNQGPPANSYVAMKLLGSNPFPKNIDSLADLATKTYFNAWTFRASTGEVEYYSPTFEDEDPNRWANRYARMTATMYPQSKIDALRLAPKNVTLLLSTGPFETLYPDSSMTVVFAIVTAKKFGQDHARFDTPEQRSILFTNLDWAQKTYDGEDQNGNNILDEGEDFNGNGILDRYSLPQPPRRPKVRVEIGDRDVTLYWDKSAESSVDPISQEKDFEGYRIYRSNPGLDITSPEEFLLNMSLIAEYDIPENNIGYDVGFSKILLPEAKYFPGDTVAYWYRFPPPDMGLTHLNGWQYLYGITAYDRGDSVNKLPSLESAKVLKRVVPGTAPSSNTGTEIGVYPNPYYVRAYWEGTGGERNRKLIFYNLPARCEIRIYTLAGDIVATIQHDAATYDGSDIEWFRKFETIREKIQFSGGEHAWDLISRYDQTIATGLYLFSVKDLDTGDIKVGKFLVIK